MERDREKNRINNAQMSEEVGLPGVLLVFLNILLKDIGTMTLVHS